MAESEQKRPGEPGHVPVLLEESLDGLKVRPDGRYIDATLGAGGHAEAILKRLSEGAGGMLLGIDQDRRALAAAAERLKPYGGAFITARGNFRDIGAIARERGLDRADGILFDLGISSMQIDVPQRGFSFRGDAALDMRMDEDRPLTAREVVNEYPERELAGIFRELGEERKANRVARAIVEERKKKAIETTGELARIVSAVHGRTGGRIHPATRVFQALRIHVNRELECLSMALPSAVDLLRPGGRLAVISYHSLEDRIVKDTIRFLSGRCACPARQPVCTCGTEKKLRMISRRPIRPTPAEISRNRRSRSARLRIAEKTGVRH